MAASVTTRLMSALFGTCLPLLSQAVEIPPPAYQLAAYAAGIPSEVLYSVALQESGTFLRGQKKQLVPWPWSLNVAGATYRFATRDDACKALVLAIAKVGRKQVDVGLGQVNMGWNGHRFSFPCEALNPYKNLQVTSQILVEERAKSKDWITAAGRYHRPAGGAPAERYRKLFAKHLSRVTGINQLVADNP
ncbi:lytic transglycosylase domain-containing protein [Pseudomonas cichorii]|uniref:Lytic transglycosylase domain-containing protein n=1 Tax=Pseudomonas serbiensis TaxID=3064350 RepID=A0ABT9CQG5_9PSED|nr:MULTISPECIES: lytic transglycosylase domain-containing protein [Pseudomonas]MBI6855532.1 lytic transglycosylase domain-containing protein [Pseudomonas cichorii]MBX8588617.1 lytic transglycosylase domain-containing protein [Pseudomonas cichorii]MDO7927736.1 lytic transglycosylase domain-containing protein [Pseudomonas sp. KFB-138]